MREGTSVPGLGFTSVKEASSKVTAVNWHNNADIIHNSSVPGLMLGMVIHSSGRSLFMLTDPGMPWETVSFLDHAGLTSGPTGGGGSIPGQQHL